MRRRPAASRIPLWHPRLLPVLLVASFACGRQSEPEPTGADAPLSPSQTQPGPASSAPIKFPKKPNPAIPPPADTSARLLPTASRDPDFGLDSADAARDYVSRYVRASHRYGDQTDCVVVKGSTFKGDQSLVETHNDASGKCGQADALRDRFFVSVATDRLSLDDSLKQPKLQNWPDGSSPDAPPGKVADIQDLHGWKTSLRDTFHKLELAPLRVQLYGRGSYPVVSVAGWHGAVLRTMTPEQLAGPAKALCAANDQNPLGIFAGVDRATILRINCPDHAKFEAL